MRRTAGRVGVVLATVALAGACTADRSPGGPATQERRNTPVQIPWTLRPTSADGRTVTVELALGNRCVQRATPVVTETAGRVGLSLSGLDVAGFECIGYRPSAVSVLLARPLGTRPLVDEPVDPARVLALPVVDPVPARLRHGTTTGLGVYVDASTCHRLHGVQLMETDREVLVWPVATAGPGPCERAAPVVLTVHLARPIGDRRLRTSDALVPSRSPTPG